MGLMGAEGNSTLGGLLKRGGAPHKEAPTLPRSLVLPAFGSFRFFGLQPQADSGTCPAEWLSSRRAFVKDTRAQQKLPHTWIILVIIKQHLVQIGRRDGPTKGKFSMGENRLEKIDVGINRLCQQISAPLRG